MFLWLKNVLRRFKKQPATVATVDWGRFHPKEGLIEKAILNMTEADWEPQTHSILQPFSSQCLEPLT